MAVIRMKDPLFQAENEWRLVHCRGPDSGERRVCFRVRGSVAIPYVVLGLQIARGQRLPIKQVILGPGVDGESGERSVQMLLREHGHHATVARTMVRLRVW